MTDVDEASLLERWQRWLAWALGAQRTDAADPWVGGFDNGVGWCDGRHAGTTLANLLAVRCWSERLDVDIDAVDQAICAAAAFLVRRQNSEGQLDLAGTYSPNEVGFTLPGLAMGFQRAGALGDPALDPGLRDVETFLRRGAEAVLAGSAYTANHRWAAACAPLAAVHALWPDARYLRKIDDYLADGIDCNDDGCWYEERSPNYNNVANHGLIVMADALGRPELLEPVLRNMDHVLYLLQPNGEIDTSCSRRQDRMAPDFPPVWHGLARRAALASGDGRFTSLALDAWQRAGEPAGELMPLLFQLDDHPGPLPAPLPPPSDYERVLTSTSIVRVRRGRTALTLAADPGGHHYDTVRDQWGGPKRSDDWLHLHHGGVVLESVRLAGSAHMANIQPSSIEQHSPGRYALAGQVAGWSHPLLFRPGAPRVHIPWDWSHQIDLRWEVEDELHLRVRSDTPRGLLARLTLWVRAGASFAEGGADPAPVVAGSSTALHGGDELVLREGDSEARISGLPTAAHRMPLDHPPGIPSKLPMTAGQLHVGLLFPVDVQLCVRLGTLA